MAGPRPPLDRDGLVREASAIITKGSQSFALASRLFSPLIRERALLLYAWCRAADDMTDGQELGHGNREPVDSQGTHEQLEHLTALALDSDEPVPLAFAALRQVARETAMPRELITDHLAGFALDAAGWQPESEADLLRYCYHVAGSVGCMMAVVMGVDPDDHDTLDRACDLGLSFQLANIARDIVADGEAGRCYLPADWLRSERLDSGDLTLPAYRARLSVLSQRLVTLSSGYRLSARLGAARLPFRSRLAVLAADAIYGAIGEKVAALGPAAWDRRASTSPMEKAGLLAAAIGRCLVPVRFAARDALWSRAEIARHHSS